MQKNLIQKLLNGQEIWPTPVVRRWSMIFVPQVIIQPLLTVSILEKSFIFFSFLSSFQNSYIFFTQILIFLVRNIRSFKTFLGEVFLVYLPAAAAAKSLQLCPTLCDPIDGSPPGSPIPGILQARTLEWVAISFSNAWKWKVKVKSLGCVRLSATPWTAAHQAPLSMRFSRQEYWSGLPLPSLDILPKK